MIRCGAASLSNSELVALLLRTGSTGESVMALAQRLIATAGGIKGLSRLSLQELTRIRGVGMAKAIQVLAGIELGRRISRLSPEERFPVRTPEDAARYVMDELRFEQQELFVCLFLDTRYRVIDKKVIFKGSLNASIVHPREIFHEAIRHSAAAIICVHNHPSGDPAPSKEDLDVTVRILEAGRILGIELLDHLIIGDSSWYSMKEKGLIPE
ncbi:RadC family protein [Staphylospora marina]|uniref:RadC family protein n=1 Tax=Staphylospora marina TaxID=2490858 RepID=UPI001F14A02B|nr:DNA repair protein RadC [Staphylospora marina]